MRANPAPNRPDYAGEHRAAVAAAKAAGRLLRGRVGQGFAVRPKGERGDVVTDLDLLAEELIVTRLRAQFPADRIVAEESGLLEGAAGGRRTWLVDPLDGSNNVAIGLPVWSVGIALCVADHPVVGVVHDPVVGRTWSAWHGGGAHGPDGPLAGPPARADASGPLLAWTQGYAVDRDDDRAGALKHTLELRARRLLQLWAPLSAWAMLARGDIDGFVGYRPELVDLPAGLLLAREAGVTVRTFAGTELAPRFGSDADFSFVAGRVELVDELLGLVAEPR
ncbi:inositol monophosphatase family protein [Streptacidiphilus rugosus]|uniref:inositol monophosphatase family protein n=1 Tax=Streptacidiphilus rugosus TaxID=405783 RepID=UPI000560DA60|nr:inositol monophosphatase family protein [Streptacidiphilus rugosus]